MREKDLKETGLADMAYKVDKDHEVQMARADLYKIAKYGIKLHEMLAGISEEQGLDGWVQAKITKAADYLGSVYHHLDYETKFDEVTEAKKQAAPEKMKVTDADKKAGTEAYKRMKAGDDRYVDATTKKVEEARSSASDQAAKAGAYNGGKSIGNTGNKKPGLQGKDLEDYRAKRSAEYEEDLVKKRAENAARLKSYGEGLRPAHAKELRNKELNKDKGPAKSGKTTGPDDYDFLKYKNKKVKEGGSYEDTLFAKLAEANSKKKLANCSECGNPSYTTLDEETSKKKKGSHGKVCWKGYRRGKGDSCHRVKGDA